MTAWHDELRSAGMALQFLTRLPVPHWVGHEPARFQRAVRHFPLVGALVGAAGAAVALGALHGWPATVAATLAVATTVWLTAALHEDGLADTFDALLGAAPRAQALAIMKDSRIGSHGAVALLLVLGLRVLLLAELLARAALPAATALVAAHAAGRAAAVVLMAALPYAGDAAQAKAPALMRGTRRVDAAWAALTGALVLALAAVAQPRGAVAFGSATGALVALVLVMRRWLQRRLGGCTGDTLGAAEQLAEVAVLLAFAANGPR